MTFNQTDTTALQRALDLGFPMMSADIGQSNPCVGRIVVRSSANLSDATAIDFANALQSSIRFFGGDDTTLWLDLDLPIVPEFIVKGIEHCAGFGMGLVVTHQHVCSHSPGHELPARLQLAVAQAGRRGMLWHPVLRKLVFADLPGAL